MLPEALQQRAISALVRGSLDAEEQVSGFSGLLSMVSAACCSF
jgi:hypothetical protein